MEQQIETQSQQKADTGMAMVLQEKNRTITKLMMSLSRFAERKNTMNDGMTP